MQLANRISHMMNSPDLSATVTIGVGQQEIIAFDAKYALYLRLAA